MNRLHSSIFKSHLASVVLSLALIWLLGGCVTSTKPLFNDRDAALLLGRQAVSLVAFERQGDKWVAAGGKPLLLKPDGNRYVHTGKDGELAVIFVPLGKGVHVAQLIFGKPFPGIGYGLVKRDKNTLWADGFDCPSLQKDAKLASQMVFRDATSDTCEVKGGGDAKALFRYLAARPMSIKAKIEIGKSGP